MPAEKKSKSKSVKKTSGGGGAKKNAAQSKNAGSGGNNTAFFVLVIIVLVTIIVLMLNRFYDKGDFGLPDFKKIFPPAGDVKDKKSGQVKEQEPAEAEKDKKAEDVKEKEPAAAEIEKPKNEQKNEKSTVSRKDVSIYLLKLDEKTERIYLSSVRRTVTDKNILYTALDNLIKGPSQQERDKGYITAVPAGLKVRGIAIRGKIAEIDFNGSIEEGAAGDILLKRVQQIVYTATQFDSIESVIIKINGQRRKSMGSDGFSISGPLKR